MIGKDWQVILPGLNSSAKNPRGKGAMVAGDLLRKLFNRKRVLPSDVAEVQAELKSLAKDRPILAELAGQLSDCLTALYAEPIHVVVPSLTNETAAHKLNAGVPLLRG